MTIYDDMMQNRLSGETPSPVNITTDANGNPTRKMQPKVATAAITGIALTVILGAITAMTPEHFAALGMWGGVIYGGIVALGSSIAAYLKRPGNVS